MLLPKFSIRLMLVLTAVTAVFFFIVSLAVNGSKWAVGLSLGFGLIPVFFLAYAFFFLIAYILTRFTKVARPKVQPVSPFSPESLPTQIIPPKESNAE